MLTLCLSEDFKSAASTGFATLARAVSRRFPGSLQELIWEQAGNAAAVRESESRRSPEHLISDATRRRSALRAPALLPQAPAVKGSDL